MALEELLYGQKNIRNFLKLFSEQQWNRVTKATLLLGIQYLKHLTANDLTQLSIKQIEDIIVTNEESKSMIGLVVNKQKNDKRLKEEDKKKEKKNKKRQNHDKIQNESSYCETSDVIQSQPSEASEQINNKKANKNKEKRKKREKELQKSPEVLVKARQQDIRPQSANVVTRPVAFKAPSTWRRGTSQKPGNYQSRFQVDNPHAQQKQPRSTSLNPLIYPSWWGQEDEDEFLNAKQGLSTRNSRKKEDSLDKRLQEAEKRKKQQENIEPNKNGAKPPTQTYYHQQHYTTQDSRQRMDTSSSNAYTSSKATKYSPIRERQPGSSNQPMSYAGPPSVQEINRNQNRQFHINEYNTGNQPVKRNLAREQNGGFSKGDGAVMSYSPPKQRKHQEEKQKKKQNKNQNGKSQVVERQSKQVQPSMIYRDQSNRLEQSSKQVPKHLNNVQSKIKDKIEYHKQMHKDANQSKVFSKEPQILYKPLDQYNMQNGNKQKTANNYKGAALRRKPSPVKENSTNYPQVQEQQDQFSLRGTQGQWPASSIENINNSNNRSSSQNFYNQRTRQQPNLEGGFSGAGAGPGTVGEITQGLINSPIMSQFSESSPDKSIRPTTAHQVQKSNRRTKGVPIMQQQQQQYQYQDPHQMNNDSNDVVMFRSDGFEQSRFYNQTHGNNISRFSKYPQAQQQNVVTSSGEMNTSTFKPSNIHTLDNTRPSNPFSKNQNQSGISGYYRELPSQRMTDEQFRQREAPNEQWVGEYVMNKKQQQQDQRNLHDLAQSNSYTYTLQNPLSNQQQPYQPPRGIQTYQSQQESQVDDESEESEDSDLSNYSPNDDIRGFFQHQYQQDLQDPQLIYSNQVPIEQNQQQNIQRPVGEDNVPYQYQLPSTKLQGVELSRRHRDINFKNNGYSDSGSSSNSEYYDEENNDYSQSQSSSNLGSNYSDSQISSSSYQSGLHPQTAASGFYRGGNTSKRAQKQHIQNQTHH